MISPSGSPQYQTRHLPRCARSAYTHFQNAGSPPNTRHQAIARPLRSIADALRPRPPAICTWATRAPSGRRFSARARPAARWSCAWKIWTPTAAARTTPRPRSTICAGWGSAGKRARSGRPRKGRSVRSVCAEQAPRRLPRRVAQAAAHRPPVSLPLFAQGPGRPPSARRMSARNRARRRKDRKRADEEPLYPGTCRLFMGGTPQLPGPTASEFEDAWRHQLALPRSRWRSDRIRRPQSRSAAFCRRSGLRRLRRLAARRRAQLSACLRGRRCGHGASRRSCAAPICSSQPRAKSCSIALWAFDHPAWYHCRLVVDHNGRRLAKRHDALSLRALRQRGLTPMNILSAELARRS